MSARGWYLAAADAKPELRGFEPELLGDQPVRVRVERSALNYKDALALTGSAPIARVTPLILGIDFAGRVEASTDPRFAPGDPVLATGWGLGERHHGGLATLAACPGDWLHRLPAGTDADWAMGLGTAGLTAWLAVERLRAAGVIPARGTVAVTGASGGVGSLAVALLDHLGYTVHAISGTPAAAAELRALGATEVLEREVLAPGKPLRPARFAGAVDTVGGAPLGALLAQIAPLGAVAACGNAAGMALPTSVAPFILRGVSLLGIDSVGVPREERELAWAGLAEALPPDTALPRRVLDLDQALDEAHRMLRGQGHGRRLVRCT